MPKVKWAMLCPMARSGSSHTSELLCRHEGMWSHHGLFNNGPMGRWPSKDYIPLDRTEYYSAVLDDRYVRTGGLEHSGEFLDRYIFTNDPRFNPRQWECVGFKVQYVHLVNMPDLREYLIRNRDIRIILNTRRDLLEHAAAEEWCANGSSRAARRNEPYRRQGPATTSLAPAQLFATFENLCRYREDAITTFDTDDRPFFEWSLEDMFDRYGDLNQDNHRKLFDFLDMQPSGPFASTFVRTPRPGAREYLANFEELKTAARTVDGGIFAKYFEPDYDPYTDHAWPKLSDYRLNDIMKFRDNTAFRAGA